MDMREKLHGIAMEEGVDFFGVAPAKRWEGTACPEGFRPWDLLLGAKSVISLGRSIPRGTVVANNRTFSGTRHAKVFRPMCRTATSGLVAGSAGRLQADLKGQIHDMNDWFDVNKRDNIWNKMERYASMCGICMSKCRAGKDAERWWNNQEK